MEWMEGVVGVMEPIRTLRISRSNKPSLKKEPSKYENLALGESKLFHALNIVLCAVGPLIVREGRKARASSEIGEGHQQIVERPVPV